MQMRLYRERGETERLLGLDGNNKNTLGGKSWGEEEEETIFYISCCSRVVGLILYTYKVVLNYFLLLPCSWTNFIQI